jgi:hypothetical protein
MNRAGSATLVVHHGMTHARPVRGLVDRAWAGCPPRFAPVRVIEIKALACRLPAESGVPLSRWTCPELAREARRRGIVERVCASRQPVPERGHGPHPRVRLLAQPGREIVFSVVRREAVSSNDFIDLDQIEQRLAAFEQRYSATARPFNWKFTQPTSTTYLPGSNATNDSNPHHALTPDELTAQNTSSFRLCRRLTRIRSTSGCRSSGRGRFPVDAARLFDQRGRSAACPVQ